MARGVQVSPPASELPKVSFQKIQDEESTQPGGVHDMQARSYGYNNFDDFTRPDHYIRHIEPLEIDLARQVEYDMDEQDKEWMDAVNAERKKEQLNKVTYETFEVVMDRLEKEWFDLTKNIPKPDLALPSEDSTCAICDDSEGENSNAIVFCDGCNLAVHQDCYGVPYIPEGQWLCRKCTVSPENPVSCILCPNEGGAFKQTVHGDWVHLLCAIWVPETRVANDVFMEPVTGVEKISKQRWKLKCSVCDIREGACIQCAKTSCFLAFHTTCARKEKLLLPMKSTQGSEPVALTAYCDRHLPKQQQDIRTAALAAEEALEEANPSSANKLSKSARAYAKTYKPGPPLVPALIVERILQYVNKVVIRKKPEFILMVCRYWSLKREARRGAPLLKRLHLEPWTANAASKAQSEEEKAMKLEQLKRLRDDLERVRELTELSRKRETRKLRQVEIVQDLLAKCLFPHEPPLRMAFERIMVSDRQGFFKNPVSKADVPDYFDIIKRPMCWSFIDAKLDRHEYWDLQAFKNDLQLVVDNAILYNKSGTPFYKAALRIQTALPPILQDLERLTSSHVSHSDTSPNDNTTHDESTTLTTQSPFSLPPIGDLEPPIDLLELLFSSDAIQDDIDYLIDADADPLTSLANFELGELKPPPPPPPPPPPRIRIPKPPKVKKDRTAEYEKRRAQKAAAREAAKAAAEAVLMEEQVSVAEATSLQIPRTRRAVAAAAAFEAEAEGQTPAASASSPAPADEPSSSASGSSAQVKSRPPRTKKQPVVLPSQAEPVLVENVDNKAGFALFNTGWIFPSDQKRGGRVQATLPPLPKKRARNASSALSVFSTAAEDNQTLQASGSGVDNMDVDQQQQHSPLATNEYDTSADLSRVEAQLLDSDDFIPPGRLVTTATGKTIIEELDTPAIRRAKAKRRKQLQMAGQSTVKPPSSSSSSQPVAGPSSKVEIVDGDSELSSLSELGSEEAHTSTVPVVASPPKVETAPLKENAKGKERGAFDLKEGERLDGGTLVWAKADTYPWWPAVIFENDDPHVPPNIKMKCEQAEKRRTIPIYIVQFFDTSNSWQWLALDRLRELGEDLSFDEEFLAPTSKMQKWSNSKVRTECREAYRRAMAEMETDDEGEGEGDAGDGEEPEEVAAEEEV